METGDNVDAKFFQKILVKVANFGGLYSEFYLNINKVCDDWDQCG